MRVYVWFWKFRRDIAYRLKRGFLLELYVALSIQLDYKDKEQDMI